MNSMIKALVSIPQYQSFRRFNFPKKIPLNFTILITTKCNSRCKTCNIWKQIRNDLTMNEWNRVLGSIGTAPYWFTISGGEPFLLPHTADLAIAVYKHCRPGVINIPTNSLLVDKINRDVRKILKNCPNTRLVINLSIDGVGKKHDQIRGVKGNFDQILKNYRNLKKLKRKYSNLTLGFHTVISKFNVADIPEVVDFCYSLKPDQYITEIAEQRVELDTVGLDITPDYPQYKKAINYVIDKLKQEPSKGFGSITRAFRLEYYQFVKNWRARIPTNVTDYAGWSSCEISSWGEVWPSCIGGINLGNLRNFDYDFTKVWFGKTAGKVRSKLKNKDESFPLANAFYTNALCNQALLLKVISRIRQNR